MNTHPDAWLVHELEWDYIGGAGKPLILNVNWVGWQHSGGFGRNIG
jgi:hypothetical protein